MLKQGSHQRLLRFLFCFLGSLAIFLSVGAIHVSYAQPVTEASTVPPSELVQQGLERYHQGDLPGAIALWQQSLSPLEQDSQLEAQLAGQLEPRSVETTKYLARAHRQLGQMSEAMSALDQLVAHYRQAGQVRQLGQILTEQAQVYDELGQPKNALLLLCGEQTDPNTCDRDSTGEQPADQSSEQSGEQSSALALSRQQSDPLGESAALGALGQTYYLQGDYEWAIAALESSLEIAEAKGYIPYKMAAFSTLGNVYSRLSQRSDRYAQLAQQAQDSDAATQLKLTAETENKRAADYFSQGLSLAQSQGDTTNILQAQLNLVLPTYRQSDLQGDTNDSQVTALLQDARNQLQALPDSREKAYSTIRIATLLGQISQPLAASSSSSTGPNSSGFTQCLPVMSSRVETLQQAITISKRIQDAVAESFALGSLGHLYECAGDYDAAQQLTERAQLLANRPETTYLWEWQSGRILAAQGKSVEAIALYERTVNTLTRIQGDIAIANRELRLDFRDAVEVIYRQLTELRLNQVAQSQASHQALKSARAKNTPQALTRESLLSALYTLDGLRLAELRNYLGSECDLALAPEPPGRLRPTAATISTLILKDRLAVILALPDADGQVSVQLHEVPISNADLTQQINTFRYQLEQRSDRANRYLASSQQLYDWLIRPFTSALVASNIQSITFNHDGILRMVPMAALHDGEQFLVQTYGVSNSSSFAAATAPIASDKRLKVLAFGLSSSAQVSPTEQFSPLASVATEIAQIEQIIPDSTVFLNEDFTQQKLQDTLATAPFSSPFSVLHLATHAQFGYDASDTFLVTGEQSNLYNQPLRLNELYRLLQQLPPERPPLQMLMLSACETAVGSERDALGFAGVAVQAGVKSAIASLWQVEDRAVSELTARFYGHLYEGVDRSRALQMTQQEWLLSQTGPYQHPGYWAALVLIENGV